MASGFSADRWAFHVFLSFRGIDTRRTFTDHLYVALQRKGIKVFRDDEEIAKAGVISLQLPKAIQESLSYVVILSPNYASSTWCLDELQKILECRKELGREVMPIFYGVDPSHVRHQKETFEKAMQKHEHKFGKDSEKVRNWRAALEEIANTSGWVDTQHPLETELIEKIAEAVWIKTKDKLPSYPNNYVGMESKIKKIDSLLEMGLDDVRFIGIWGMGGIGKTTIARVIFDTIEHNFELKYFLHNVREVSARDGLPYLQKKILSRLKLPNIEIDHPYDGKNLIRNLLCNKKVLLVLDDVNHRSQLENLAGMQDWFGPGSRVIVTTRDMHLLKSQGVSKTYEVKLLRSSESLQLFYQKAFKKDQSREGFLDLSNDVIKYAGGLPLALEVLGSYLNGKTISEWKCAMGRMRQFPEDEILKPLRISFETLNVPNKNIFLDFACLLKGMDNDRVMQIIERCGLYLDSGIKDLIDKSLLTQYFDDDGKWHLEMHQILQEMGKNIVLQESPFPSKRSRLWSQEDINRVLTNNEGSELIQGIVLEFPEPYEAQWHREAFSKMCNLRLLVLSNVHLPRGLNCFSSSLKVVEWKGYPLKFLPLDVGLHELVDLKLHHSKIKQCWNGTQFLGQIKFVDLSWSKDLVRTPDFNGMPNLERLVLEGCISLTDIHPSIAKHKRLLVLNMKDCQNLKTLPKKLEMNSLEIFVLCGCSKIKKISEFGETMINLLVLDLEGTTISKLPDSLVCLVKLAVLSLRNCRNIVCLPSTIWNFKSLRSLNISGCSKFSSLPENLDENETLEELDVSGTAIREVPSSIECFKKLKYLSFKGCQGSPSSSSWSLQLPFGMKIKFWKDVEVSSCLILPPSLPLLASLQSLNLSYCNLRLGMIPNDFGSSTPSLKDLILEGNNFGVVDAGTSVLPLSNLTSLNSLSLLNCCLPDGSFPDDLSNLSSLQHLNLCGNNFTHLPARCLSNLTAPILIWLSNCPNLQSLPQLPPNLQRLDAGRSPSLEEALSDPKQLWSLFTSLDLQRSSEGHVVLEILGSEVPSWFENQSFIFDEDTRNRYGYDSVVTIVADIPSCWRWSEWSGIAMCVVVDGQFEEPLWERVMFWSSKDPEGDWPRRIFGYIIEGREDRPQLFIRFLPFNHDNCWQHVKGDEKNLQLHFMLGTKTRPSGGVKSSEGPPRKFEIKKCGWRLLCKEDVEEYWRFSASNEEECYKSPFFEKECVETMSVKTTQEEEKSEAHPPYSNKRKASSDSDEKQEAAKKSKICGK